MGRFSVRNLITVSGFHIHSDHREMFSPRNVITCEVVFTDRCDHVRWFSLTDVIMLGGFH